MNDRLSQFLAAENISQSTFADTIGVARASVSHIIAGRNKPGYDFLCSIMEHYPSLNPEWLILGKGKMYKVASQEKEKITNTIDNQQQPSQSQPSKNQIVETEIAGDEPQMDLFSSSMDKTPTIPDVEKPVQTQNVDSKTPENQRTISKIIVFYSDNTFQELNG